MTDADRQARAEQVCNKIEQHIVDATVHARAVPSAEIKAWWIKEIANALSADAQPAFTAGATAQRERDARIPLDAVVQRETWQAGSTVGDIREAIAQAINAAPLVEPPR